MLDKAPGNPPGYSDMVEHLLLTHLNLLADCWRLNLNTCKWYFDDDAKSSESFKSTCHKNLMWNFNMKISSTTSVFTFTPIRASHSSKYKTILINRKETETGRTSLVHQNWKHSWDEDCVHTRRRNTYTWKKVTLWGHRVQGKLPTIAKICNRHCSLQKIPNP